MKTMQARKTEYKGIVFASKAEARLALFLDAQRKNWWYQPKSLSLPDGYTPDFMVLELDTGCYDDDVPRKAMSFKLSMAIVEYKPKRPTSTYINELGARFRAIGDLLYAEKTLDEMLGCVVNVDFLLMVGGMGYQKAEFLSFGWCGPDRDIWVAREWRQGWGYCFEEIEPDAENKRLSSYRFDLETELESEAFNGKE